MELKEAIKVLVEEFHLGDYVYNVRSRAAESGDGFKGDSWEHPKVKRFAEVVERLKQELTS